MLIIAVGGVVGNGPLGFASAHFTAFIKRTVSEGALMLDVGANIGFYSLIAAKRGCQAVAFEPHPRIAEQFRSNLALNPDLQNRVTINECGVGKDQRATSDQIEAVIGEIETVLEERLLTERHEAINRDHASLKKKAERQAQAYRQANNDADAKTHKEFDVSTRQKMFDAKNRSTDPREVNSPEGCATNRGSLDAAQKVIDARADRPQDGLRDAVDDLRAGKPTETLPENKDDYSDRPALISGCRYNFANRRSVASMIGPVWALTVKTIASRTMRCAG